MLLAVDRSGVNGPKVIESPALGVIAALQRTGGAKTLPLIASDRKNRRAFNASTCGDNCAQSFSRGLRHSGDGGIALAGTSKNAHRRRTAEFQPSSACKNLDCPPGSLRLLRAKSV